MRFAMAASNNCIVMVVLIAIHHRKSYIFSTLHGSRPLMTESSHGIGNNKRQKSSLTGRQACLPDTQRGFRIHQSPVRAAHNTIAPTMATSINVTLGLPRVLILIVLGPLFRLRKLATIACYGCGSNCRRTEGHLRLERRRNGLAPTPHIRPDTTHKEWNGKNAE